MDCSRALLTKIIEEDALNKVTRSGITPEFLDEDSQPIFNFIQRHYAQYKQTPSHSAIKQAFPNFVFTSYKEPLEYFIEQLKEAFRRNIIEDGLTDVSSIYNTDTKKTESIIRETLSRLTVTQRSFKDIDLAGSATDRVSTYLERKENPGADGILSSWQRIDYITLGFHSEEFIVIAGEKYIGKSWILLYLAYQFMKQGERVLFVTKEMSQYAMARRFDSIYSNVKFDSLRRGELSEVEEQRYKERMGSFAESSDKLILARAGVETIDDIEQKAVEVDATVILGDSIYLFNPDHRNTYVGETPRRMAISQRCKSVSQTLGIPFIVTTQAGRKKSKNEGPHLDRIEWSNAFSQDADVIMYIEKTEVDRSLNRLKLYLLKTRDGDLGAIHVKTDFEYMTFEQDNTPVEPTTNILLDEDENEETIFQETSQ